MSLTVLSSPVEVLPNEILALTLTRFSLKELLPVSRVSRRFHSIVAQILHCRLLDVASLPGHDLVLECYPPIARLTTPSFTCHYLGTKKMSNGVQGPKTSLSILDRQQYASFRPAVAEEDRRTRRRSQAPDEEDDLATEYLDVDEDDLFSQLCVKVHVVKPGPRTGLFVSHVNVFDGVLRIWRDWLVQMSDSSTPAETKDQMGKLLWAGSNRVVGIRFQVAPGAMEQIPVLAFPHDLPPISFKMVYSELLVPATELLLAMERSAIQEISHSGKAIVIASM